MADLKFDDVKKQNRISVIFALEFVVDGISKFKDDEFSNVHNKLVVMQQHFNYPPCMDPNNPCSQKHSRDLRNWCPTCIGWRTSILNSHKDRGTIGRYGADWSKIDSSKWPSDLKEVEKCYNPKWCNASKNAMYNDGDVAVIIGKIINCVDIRSLFQSTIDPNNIRIIRNTVHHDREISETDKKRHCQTMLDFLKTPCVWAYPEAKDAYNKIQIFQSKNYIDVVKEKAIKEDELRRIEERIPSYWSKCYTIPLYMTLALLGLATALLIPLAMLGFKEFKKTEFYPYIDIYFQELFSEPEWKGSVSCENTSLITREEWGARVAKSKEFMPSPVLYVFVHHTGGIHCEDKKICRSYVQATQKDHMYSNGWADVGYNFMIGEDGHVYEGRGWNTVGAHTYGWNRNSVSFAFLGNYNNKGPEARAIRSLKEMICWGLKNGKISTNYSLFGHRDKSKTDSPGHYLYAIISKFDHFHYHS